MSSNKHEYLVILPDRSGALAQRLRVRPEHLERLTARVESGFWKLGGALLDEELKDGETPSINGSVMMALAQSKEEVLSALKEDIYSTSGVWDWEKVTIHPFKSAFIKP